jgi:hypothetical protein
VSDIGAGKLIASLLGIAGRRPTADPARGKPLGPAGTRLYVVPSAVIGWSQLFGEIH